MDTLKLGYGDYLRFRDLVLARSGLHFPEKKWTDLEIGLSKALHSIPDTVARGIGSLDLATYYCFLKEAATPPAQAEMERLINLLTIGETHFFRDSAQFDALATHVLPELIARKRAAALGSTAPGIPQLRLWSAGCASGEEAYSLAILLHQLIPDISNWRILILATDINQDSLALAQQALYSDWSFRESRAKTTRSLYFTLQDKRYKLLDDIRQMVTFAPLNLIEDNFPAAHNNTLSIDLILCRNVTIYFTEETTRRLINKFYQALVEGGWLVVGHAELSLVIYRAFQARSFPDTVLYQKTGQPTLWPNDWVWLDPPKKEEMSQLPSLSGLSEPVFQPTRKDNLQTKPLSPLPSTQPGLNSQEANRIQHSNGQASRVKAELEICQRAQLLLSKGYGEQAIATLENKFETFSVASHVPACCLLARAYADQGKWDQAQQWAERAIALDALAVEAYYTLALTYEHQGNIEQAITYLKKVIYLDQEGPLPYFNLGMLYKKRGDLISARRAFSNIVRILERWPPDKIIPDSGGTSAARLLNITRRTLQELETQAVEP